MKRLLSVLIIFSGLFIMACSDSSTNGTDISLSDLSSDASADISPDDTQVNDTEPAFIPFMPKKPENPYIDRPFIEEYNSNPSVYDESQQELIILADTSGSSYYPYPLKVSKKGFFITEDGKERLIEVISEPENLISAAYINEKLIMITKSDIIIHDSKSNTLQKSHYDEILFNSLVCGNNQIYILTDKGIGTYDEDKITLPDLSGNYNIKTAYESEKFLFAASENRVYAFTRPFAVDSKPDFSVELSGDKSAGIIAGITGDILLPENCDLIVAGSERLLCLNADDVSKAFDIKTPEIFTLGRVPLANPRYVTKMWDGGFVVATDGGAYRITDRDGFLEWRVYNYERWVASEDVRHILVNPNKELSTLYFATAKGLSYVEFKRETLEEKLKLFVERIMTRHDRDGAVADSHLIKRGDLSTNIPWDSDNDGSWTSYWLLAECFRYKVTNDPIAKANFDKSLDAMLRLRDLTGTDYFVARAVIRKEGCQLDDCDNPDDGKWYTSPDGKWWVKRDTSNDEVIAHIFMMGHAYDLCADESQKERIRKHIAGIVGGLIDHGYQLIDPVTGKVTTYGQLDPKYVNENPSGKYGDGGVRSAEMIAGLNLAYYMTGEQRFLDAKKFLMQKHHYDDNIENLWDYPFHKGNSDGDEMGTEAFFVLLRYEMDPKLRERWYNGWRKTYENALKYHQGAWWEMVNAVVGADDYKTDVVARWLRFAPVDMIRWNMHNSHRKDLIPPPVNYYKDAAIRSDGHIIPYNERRCDRWNTDQFRIDGGMGGFIEMDGADVLAPYWMARYYGFIVKE